MNVNRKSKSVLQIHKNSHSSSVKKPVPKQQHILAKPNTRKINKSKQTQSFSTLNSHNLSRTSNYKLKTTHDTQYQRQNSKQILNITNMLENQVATWKKSEKNMDYRDWYSTVERTCKNITNEPMRKMMQAVQKGYQLCIDQKKGDILPKGTKKLGLNIEQIKKQGIPDYHDEFMSKFQEYSPSWRALIQAEQKRKS